MKNEEVAFTAICIFSHPNYKQPFNKFNETEEGMHAPSPCTVDKPAQTKKKPTQSFCHLSFSVSLFLFLSL